MGALGHHTCQCQVCESCSPRGRALKGLGQRRTRGSQLHLGNPSQTIEYKRGALQRSGQAAMRARTKVAAKRGKGRPEAGDTAEKEHVGYGTYLNVERESKEQSA